MTTVNYPTNSPYFNTQQVNIYLQYLDFWKGAYPTFSISDSTYTVETKYKHRPDLLSNDLYQTTGWWWIFALWNPNIIKDPIYDLVPGITIILPPATSLPSSTPGVNNS